MPPMHTLVVDDEANVCAFLEEILQKTGYTAVSVHSGEAALDLLRENSFDLVLLDLNLGRGIDGIQVLEAIRWRWPQTLVIILTGYGSLKSAQAAIRQGVDDYLLKPVEPDKLRQAVQGARARRGRLVSPIENNAKYLRCREFMVDLELQRVTRAGELLELTGREFRLLVYLMRNVERVITPQELLQAVQGCDVADVRDARNSIKWYIYRLRRKIEPEPSEPQYILNVRGTGYTFCGEDI